MKVAPARIPDVTPLALILGRWRQETAWMPKLHDIVTDRWFIRFLIDQQMMRVMRSWRGVHGFLARDGQNVHALYIGATARGQGLGKRLIDDAKAAEPRLDLWCFQANAGARAFYLRQGFREVAYTDGAENDERLPDVLMQWERRDG